MSAVGMTVWRAFGPKAHLRAKAFILSRGGVGDFPKNRCFILGVPLLNEAACRADELFVLHEMLGDRVSAVLPETSTLQLVFLDSLT